MKYEEVVTVKKSVDVLCGIHVMLTALADRGIEESPALELIAREVDRVVADLDGVAKVDDAE